ncbi:hypothetical protein H4R22_005231 [Coemansia sp. RSA 1290]|nr:hypothetical protein H4R22_005231 [Coemansia sp. RSA 1290]
MYADYFTYNSDASQPQLMLNSNASSSSSLCSNEHCQVPSSPSYGGAPVFTSSGIAYPSTRRPSRINLEGSWLDLESDDEDAPVQRVPLRMRRKSSDTSSGRGAMANIRDLKYRSTLRIRKLTDKMIR